MYKLKLININKSIDSLNEITIIVAYLHILHLIGNYGYISIIQ